MKPISTTSATSPSVQHIASALESRIRSGEYRHGHWLPSEREIGEEFGVSRIVIQAVVKELERRKLVARAARCRPVVQNLRKSDPAPVDAPRRNIGLWIWPNPGHPGSGAIVQGISRDLDHDAFRLIIAHPGDRERGSAGQSESRFLLRMAQDRDIVGIILWHLGAETNRETLQQLREAHIPLVFIDRRPPEGFSADYVGVDNELAAEEVVKHLLSQGHRSIAHISNFDTASTVQERSTGYRRALEKAGVACRPELVQRAPQPEEDDPQEGCGELLDVLLGLPDPPTALFAINDYVALRLLAALRMRQIRVPEEMAVAGFDGIERWTPGRPFLTTANQPFERIGAQALKLLLQQVAADATPMRREILLEAPLSVHASTRASHGVEAVAHRIEPANVLIPANVLNPAG